MLCQSGFETAELDPRSQLSKIRWMGMEMAASESKVHTYMTHLHCIDYVFVPKRESTRTAREKRRERAAISVSTCMLAAPCA